jgi:hypothetical protein
LQQAKIKIYRGDFDVCEKYKYYVYWSNYYLFGGKRE